MTTEMLLYCTNQYDPGMDDFNLFVDICKFYLKCVCFYLVCWNVRSTPVLSLKY